MQKIIIFNILVLLFNSSYAIDHDKAFEKWKVTFAKRAAKKGLKKSWVLEVLKETKYDPKIIEKDRNQLTSSTTLDYQAWIPKWL
jgi:membrane-bound lytic murein transglycosylase B